MKSNLTLIGMPGAGKSTVGIILAKNLTFGFLDTDVLIQINQQKSLQQIIDGSDHLNLRRIEEGEILKLNIDKHIIATGGSVPYSEKAMEHLKNISEIVFLYVSYDELERRIHNFETRGISKAPNQTFKEIYDERQILYKKYADIVVDCYRLNQDQVAMEIVKSYILKDAGVAN
ncbi:MAG: shikimate kinase [Desulfamplus sp.]|nr:shikimate kinase [Desulfamplus sp.]